MSRAGATSAGPLLAEPNFLRVWLAGACAATARWLEMLAVGIFVFEETGSPLLVAAMLMLRMLPLALFGALGGEVASRFDRRRVLLGTPVAVVTVMPSDAPPVRHRGRIWIRVGPRRAVAGAQDERILNEKRRHRDPHFDVQPVPTASVADLDLRRFDEEYLPLAVDVLGDIFLNSVFDPDEIERERTVILQEIASADENPEDFVHDLFSLDYFGDHPLGRPVCGEADTVTGFTRDDLVGFMAERYLPGRVVIAGAGNLSHSDLVEAVAGDFVALQARPLEDGATPPEARHGLYRHPRKLGQVHVCLGAPGLPHGDPRQYAAHVLNTLLGGGMSSRLFQEIRERRGKAYAVYSFLSSYRDAGYLGVYVGTKAEWTREVIDLAVEEMFKVAEGKVTGEELARAQNQLVGNTLLGLESADSWMSHMVRCEMHHGRQISLEEIVRGVRDVSLDALTALAREFFVAGSMTATVLGDLDGHGVEGLPFGSLEEDRPSTSVG